MPEDPEDDTKGTCDLCGERYDMMSPFDSLLVAEWYDPKAPQEPYVGIIAHPDCALQRGLEMS